MRSRRRAAKARAALFWAAGLFVAVQLGLAFMLDSICPAIARPVFEGRAAPLRQMTTDRPLILMLGSSRTSYGLDAARLEACLTQARRAPLHVFNFGTLGAGPITELLHLRRLLAAGIEPDLLLIEVLPPFLAGQLRHPVEARWLPACTRLSGEELAFLQQCHFPMHELRQTRALSWAVPVSAHRAALLSGWLSAWLPYPERLDWAWDCDAHGWTPQTEYLSAEQYRQRVQEDRRQYIPAFQDFRVQGAPARALCELLATCRRRTIPAALVLMPEGSTFRGWYPADAQAQLDAFLDDLQRRYGVPRIDARRWMGDADFVDAHHLCAHGATAFSTRLGKEIERRGICACAKR